MSIPLPPPETSESGVDVTLIDAFLALTPEQRLLRNQELSAEILALQEAVQRALRGTDESAPRRR